MGLRPGYKQTEIGVLPIDWDVKPLGKFLALRRGHDLTEYNRRQGDIPVIGSGGPNGFHDTALVKGPGVVLGRSGASFGQAHYCVSDFWPHNTALYVTDFFDNNRLFAFYLLKSINFSRHNSGGAQQSLNRNFIAPIPIGVPPVYEQEIIAEALSDADALVGSLEKLIIKKRHLKRGAMQVLVTGKKRLPGFSEEWEVMGLGDIAEIRDGTHQTPKYVESGIPFLSVENVTSGDFSNTKFISEAEHCFLTKSFKIEKGDILMTRIGSIGDCKLIDWDIDASFYVSLALLKIRKGYSAEFICHYSESAYFKKEVELNSLQSAIPKKINLGPISHIKIEIPVDPNEQTAIAAVLSDMDAEIAELEAKLDKARRLKQGMMHNLLTGGIRLV